MCNYSESGNYTEVQLNFIKPCLICYLFYSGYLAKVAAIQNEMKHEK